MPRNGQNSLNPPSPAQQAGASSPPINRQKSLRWRLLTLLSAILLFTLLMIGLGVSGFVSQTEQAAWRGRQQEAARNAALTVAAFVQRVNTTLTGISLLGRNELKSEPALLLEVLKDNPALLEVIYLDGDGRLLASVHQDASVLADLFTIPQSNWFRHARAGEHYLGDLQLSPANEPYLILAAPAAGGGVVAARLQMKVLGETVAAISFGDSGQAYVVNQAGQVIAHTNPQVILANMNLSERPELAAMLQASSNRWTGSYINFEGTAVVGATAPVPGTNWVVFTELAQSEAFAVTRRAWWLLSGGMLIFGVFVLSITAKLLGRMIFQPMEELQTGAERIGQGDLAHRITLTRQDEVGQVARAFNEMAEQLHNREEQLVAQTVELAGEVFERKKVEEALRTAHDELEIRVQKRTAELAEANLVLQDEIVEHARAETALRASEARYKTLFDTVPVAIFTKDRAGRYTSVNTNELSYWPTSPIGYTDQELLPLEIADKLHATDLGVLETGKPLVIEERFHTPHGLRIILSHKVPLYDATNQAIGILGASLDITERKQAEEALRDSVTRIRLITDALPALIAYVDAQQCYQFVNRQHELWYGCARTDLEGKQMSEVLDAAAYAGIRPYVETALTGQEVIFEYAPVYPDGQERYVQAAYIPHWGNERQVLGFFALIQDLTDHKKAEETLAKRAAELEELTNFLDSIIDNLPSLLFVKHAKSLKFVQFNQAWEDLLGIDRKSVIGKSDYDIFPKEQADFFTTKDKEVLASGGLLDIPIEPIQSAHKGVRLLHTRKIPVLGVDGQPKYLLGFAEDVTEQKQTEDQIKASLEEKVVLLQEIHHRVKNNLQVISSLLYLQAAKIQDPQTLDILRDSQNRVKSMALIHEKLYQTKDLSKVDLGEYIHNLASYLFRSYTASAGAVQLRVQADNVFLGIDTAAPCGLIINELVSNALKHAFPNGRPGEIQIELRGDGALPPGQETKQIFTLLVRDNGIGFPAEVDFQNTASLGLQLVNTLVNQLDGIIELQPGSGTEFKIQFPSPQ